MKNYFKILSVVLSMAFIFSSASLISANAEGEYVKPDKFIYGDVTHGDTVVLCAYWKPDSGILGDVDGNGSVSTSDVSTIQKHLNAQLTTPLTTNQLLRADVNFDGSVSVKDTSLIQKYIAQIIDEFGE